ncbi:MAG: phosphate regulon transcriptional regulator PhoB [Gammaproteobacteria bacterium]|nr:phosphate regulon transcriptional regulator PhoB [Gammaproteobacteria bacterium]
MEKCILIVEDEPAIRAMLCYALEPAGFSVQEAGDVSVAEILIAEKIPDLILLDWMLPQQSGIEFTKHLKQKRLTENIPIIMLTAKAEEENKVLGLEVGADDYIVKPFSPRELIARIHAVLRRGPLEHPDGTIRFDGLSIDTRSQRVSIDDQPLKLNPLEYRLLCFLLSHQDRVYTRDALLTHVWGGDSYIDERTVDVHVRRLRKRLEASGYSQFVQTVHGTGYRFSRQSND